MNQMYVPASKEIEPASFWVSNSRVGDGGDHWLDIESGQPLAIVRTIDQAVMRLVARGTIPPRAYHEYDELYLEKYCLPSFEQSVSAFYIDELPIGRSYGVALTYAVHVGARLPFHPRFTRLVENEFP